MGNRYTTRVSLAQVAAHFGVTASARLSAPEETCPGYRGVVVHEADDGRIMQSMMWGFPLRLNGMKPESKPGVMTDCNEAVRPIHCVPVLLHPHEYDAWLYGSVDDVVAFQERCFCNELIRIERTAEPWTKRRELA